MRHRRSGRVLGRNPSHRRAMLRNLAAALFLTERDTDEFDENAPKVKGRIITTVPKAKEVRPIVERAVTLARRVLPNLEEAARLNPNHERNSDAYKSWRKSPEWAQWNDQARVVLAARRRVLTMLGDRLAMRIVFEKIAPRFADRPGGYTRIVKLAQPRLGDAGARAIMEFVGIRDRQRGGKKAQKPTFAADTETAKS